MKAFKSSKGIETPSSSEFDEQEYIIEINKSSLRTSIDSFSIVSIDENDWIISYYSSNRLKFEFFTCILVIYDSFMAPFQWAY